MSSCENIDECSPNNHTDGLTYCSEVHASCVDTTGGYDCQCEDGYWDHQAETGCTELDECSEGHDPPDSATWPDGRGAWTAIAGSSYCGQAATCHNTVG